MILIVPGKIVGSNIGWLSGSTQQLCRQRG
jgi:hypothetical protein